MLYEALSSAPGSHQKTFYEVGTSFVCVRAMDRYNNLDHMKTETERQIYSFAQLRGQQPSQGGMALDAGAKKVIAGRNSVGVV